MEKKSFVLGFLLLVGFLSAAEEQRPIDLVVVLDTSSSMHASYREVSEYAVGPMLKDFLRIGDTFHLIGFSGVPRAEISRRVEGIGDVETIVSRMLLMYPLDPYSDVISALEYVSRYLADLPDTRPKTIVFISDGEHAPPPSGTYAGLSPEMVKVRLAEATARLKGNGWTFHLLRVPFTGTGSLSPLPPTKSTRPDIDKKAASPAVEATGQSTKEPAEGTRVAAPEEENGLDVSDAVADLLAAPVVDWSVADPASSIGATVGVIAVEFPSDLGKTDRSLSISLDVRNPSPKPVYLETQSVLVDGADRMAKRGFRELRPRSEGKLKIYVNLPSDFPLGRSMIRVEPIFSGSVRISPQAASMAVEIVEAPMARFFSAALPALLFVLGLAAAALLALLVIMLSRRVSSAPSRAAAGAASTSRAAREGTRSPSSAVPSGDLLPKAVPLQAAATPEPAPPAAASSVPVPSSAASTRPSPLPEVRPADRDADLLAGFARRNAADEAARSAVKIEAAERPMAVEPLVRREIVEAVPIAFTEGVTKRKIDGQVPKVPYEIRKADARIMLSLFVEDQNTMIGKRNIHLIKAGSSLSLGGGNSDFLVFLVPVPRRIADIHFDGERCIFIPRKSEFFPDIDSRPVSDCVGKTIRVVSQKGYELKIRLDRFEDPLASLNRFLHSIEMPGR